MLGHDFYQFLIACLLGIPAEYSPGLRGVAPEIVHVCRTEPLRIHADHHLTGNRIVSLLVHTGTLPANGDTVGSKSPLREISHCMLLAGRNDKVLRLLLLHNQPHTLHIILGIPPVAQGIHIAKLQMILDSLCDSARRKGNLPGDKILSTTLRFMVEQDTVYREHIVSLPVFLHNPEPVLLRYRIG